MKVDCSLEDILLSTLDMHEGIAMTRITKLPLVLAITTAMIALLIMLSVVTLWPKEPPMPSGENPSTSAQHAPQPGSSTQPAATNTLRYWTPERLRDVEPVPMPLIDSHTPHPDVHPPVSEEPPASVPGQPPAGQD
jgi:hypothetical protein